MDVPLKQYWNLLGRYIQPQRARFALLAALLLGSIGLQIVNPQIMRYFIDAVTRGQTVETLTVVGIAFAAMAVFQQAVSVGTTYVGEHVAWVATNALRVDLARHCIELDLGFHSSHSPGELIERIDGDVAELSNFFSQLVVGVLGNLLLLAGILLVLFLEDWRLGMAFTLFASITLWALSRTRGLAIPHQRALRQTYADLFGFLEERLAGTEDIRSSGAVAFVLRGLYRLQYSILGRWLKAHKMFVVVGFVADMLLTLGTAATIVAGYHLFRGQVMTIGTVYLLIHYINLLGRPLRGLSYQVEGLQTVGASIERLDELRHIRSKIQDGPGAEFAPGPPSLAFDDVCFAYAEGEPVLKDLSFHLQPGRVLGLLGRTGSGKTTLARLIFRLYDPTEGRVVLNGVDVRQARVKELRRRVAIVTQDVQLFRASVRDNLTFFDRSIPDERILTVIEGLELTGWYQSLPDGLDTLLGANGAGLSAGEAQLLALVRVFLRDPGLVILDEASSRLDPATERRIDRALGRLLHAPRRTAIVIAHRLSTIQRADEIMILEGGRVIEQGERERLASAPPSRFHALLQSGLEEVPA